MVALRVRPRHAAGLGTTTPSLRRARTSLVGRRADHPSLASLRARAASRPGGDSSDAVWSRRADEYPAARVSQGRAPSLLQRPCVSADADRCVLPHASVCARRARAALHVSARSTVRDSRIVSAPLVRQPDAKYHPPRAPKTLWSPASLDAGQTAQDL